MGEHEDPTPEYNAKRGGAYSVEEHVRAQTEALEPHERPEEWDTPTKSRADGK